MNNFPRKLQNTKSQDIVSHIETSKELQTKQTHPAARQSNGTKIDKNERNKCGYTQVVECQLYVSASSMYLLLPGKLVIVANILCGPMPTAGSGQRMGPELGPGSDQKRS